MTILDVTQHGAKADGVTDDTAAIQATINAAAPGDIVLVPASATCLVNPIVKNNSGLVHRSGITLQVDGVLQAIANSSPWSSVVLVQGCDGVTVCGKGKIIGDRDHHISPQTWGSEWGYGISIQASKNVQIVGGLTISKCWGDGFTVDGGSSNITVDHVTLDSNYRQNASLIDVNGANITNCMFRDAGMTNLDMEPDNANQGIRNVKVQYCNFINCGTRFPIGVKKVHVGLGSEPGIGVYQGITINNCQFDLKQQPIWAHDTAGMTGIPWWAYLLNVTMYQGLKSEAYRFLGYPTSWSKP